MAKKPIKQYTIVYGSGTSGLMAVDKLTTEVNKHIGLGWQPKGNFVYMNGSVGQKMVKFKSDSE
jgi:hypothetical protein